MTIAICPRCSEPLLTDMAEQLDIDGFCAQCCETFNIDYCPWFDDCEGLIAGVPEYLANLEVWKSIHRIPNL
jgi:hypothetical protein